MVEVELLQVVMAEPPYLLEVVKLLHVVVVVVVVVKQELLQLLVVVGLLLVVVLWLQGVVVAAALLQPLVAVGPRIGGWEAATGVYGLKHNLITCNILKSMLTLLLFSVCT